MPSTKNQNSPANGIVGLTLKNNKAPRNLFLHSTFPTPLLTTHFRAWLSTLAPDPRAFSGLFLAPAPPVLPFRDSHRSCYSILLAKFDTLLGRFLAAELSAPQDLIESNYTTITNWSQHIFNIFRDFLDRAADRILTLAAYNPVQGVEIPREKGRSHDARRPTR